MVASFIGCGGPTKPANTEQPSSPTVTQANEAAKKEGTAEESTDTEAASAIPAGNKGGARRPTPSGTPGQQ
jgi:hypothetical protein